MNPLALIIVLELVISTGVLGFSSHPQTFNKTKRTVSHILGVQIVRVDESTPNESIPDDLSGSSNTPVDNSTSNISSDTNTNPSGNSTTNNPPSVDGHSSQDSGSTTTQPEASPASPDQTTKTSDNENQHANLQPPSSENQTSLQKTPNLFEDIINPSVSPKSELTSNAQPIEQPTVQPNASPLETTIDQTQAVLNSDDLINSPENINDKSIEEVKKEESQIASTTDPKKQTQLLLEFATDKVKDMNRFSKSDDFASANFAAQRFDGQIGQAISNLDKLPQKDQGFLKKQLVNFCDQADQVLRAVELSVPEESEQDLQIARGQCQRLQF